MKWNKKLKSLKNFNNLKIYQQKKNMKDGWQD